jgi:basic amino acid/polyamine antiporter, APA family
VTATTVTERRVASGRLHRSFGIWFGIAVGVGGMIGAGILRAPADVAARLPSPGLFLGAWVLGGVYALLGANAIAELATMVPRSGGQYVFIRHALGPFAGFVVGLNEWLAACASVTALAIVEAEAIGALLTPFARYVVPIAALSLVVTGAVLLRGVRQSDQAQRYTSVIKALVLLTLVVACFLWRAFRGAPQTTVVTTLAPALGASLVLAMITALQGVIFAYDGWTGVVYFSGEVKNPDRDIPRALVGGLLSTMALYLLLNAAFLAVLPISAIASSPLAAATAASVPFGRHGGTVVHLLVALALPSALVANCLMASRTAFALAEDGLAPRRLAQVNAGGTPGGALIASVIAMGLFLLSGSVERLIALCAVMFVATYTMSFASVFVLRWREPDAIRPYRSRWHPWTTGFVLVCSLAFLAAMVASDLRLGVAGVAVLVLSYPLYRLIARRRG